MKTGVKVLFTVLIMILSITVVSAKSYKCETVDGAYYGKNGKEVDKVQYEKECVTHSCEIVGDTYYDENGNEVNQAQFETACNANVVSEMPDTASTSNYLSILIGSAIILGTTVFSISYRRVSDRG